MRLRISPVAFSTAYCAGYVLAFRFNRPSFRYYSVPHEWAWGAADGVARPGPPIVWYGLVVSAALFATAVTLMAAVPASIWGDKLPRFNPRGWLWLGPWLAAGYCAFLLRLFFS